MANYINNDLFETVYTDPSGQDWKLAIKSLIPQYTGQPLGQGAAPLSASTGYVVQWTWSNNNDPDTGGNYPGTTHIQVDPSTGAPFTSYVDAEVYTLASDFLADNTIDHSTVEIVQAGDDSIPQNWYYYNLDMAYPGLEMRWESDADDPNKAIMGSSATMSVYIDDVQEAILTRAVTNAELNLCLDVYKKDDDGDYVDWWHGIALPEALSFEVREGKRLVDLTFSCGLALLNDIDFKNDDGTPKSGRLSFKQLMFQSLRKLPHFNNFRFFVPGNPEKEVLGHTTTTADMAIALKRIVPGFTGALARVTNDITLSTYTDIYYDTDLTPYDGWKVITAYDQSGSGNSMFNFTYNEAPEVDAASGGMSFNGTDQCLFSASTDILSGDLKKTIMVSIDADADVPNRAILSQGDTASTGQGEAFLLQIQNDKFAQGFDGGSIQAEVATDATKDNQVLVSKAPNNYNNVGGWDIYSDNVQIDNVVNAGTIPVDIADDITFLGARVDGGTRGSFFSGIIHACVVFNAQTPSQSEDEAIVDDLIEMYQNGYEFVADVKGGWALSTYGTPLPVSNDYPNWDVTLRDSLGVMYCQAETFNEDKKEYDRKFEMRPDPSFISTGHVLEDMLKTLGMTLTQWEGGWHMFSRPYLFKTTQMYLQIADPDLAPHAWRYTWNISQGAQESTYEQVPTNLEYEDFAAPKAGMVKSFALPYKGVKITHEKSPSDIIVGRYAGQGSNHKLASVNPISGITTSDSDLLVYGDARLGFSGNTSLSRIRRKGMMWSMVGAANAEGYDFDANGGFQGTDHSPRAQHKRLEDGVTGGGPNLNFYDGRYLGPDSEEVSDIDLEAGETLNIEIGAYVENGRLDEHIGQTYIFHHRIELRQSNGTKYRLRRHVITQDTWTDNGAVRKTVINGSNSDVDKGWAGDKDYYIKEYNSLAWVKESDVSANEWEDCWYEVMTFNPETTKTEGDDLAETNLTALPYYGDAPMGTVYDADDDELKVDKENRFAYVKADLAVELPGTVGVDEFSTLYTECGISCYDANQGPRPVGGYAGITASMASRKADGSSRKRNDGNAVQTSPGTGSTIEMPYVVGWNKFVVRYGDQGEKNSLESYADGGAGVRIYDAGSSRLGSRFVFNNPEFKGRIKVQHQDGAGLGPRTFSTQWRPHVYHYDVARFDSSLHEQVAYETLDVLGYVRPRYEGTWVKHPGTTQGGCPAPFLPHIARCLDPNNAIAITPYRMRWQFAEGFQMEGVEVGAAYEKVRTILEMGDTPDGSSGAGGTSTALQRVGAIDARARQSAQRPQFELTGQGTAATAAGAFYAGNISPFGNVYFGNGIDDGTGVFFHELGTNDALMSNTYDYFDRFDLVDSSNSALYGTSNLDRVVVREPGMYMMEVKGTLDNGVNPALGLNTTFGFSFHKLGSVVNGSYVGDTSLKTSNILENVAFKEGNTGTGDWLDGTWTEPVRLDRGDVIALGAYNNVSAGGAYIYNDPEKLKLRLIKLSEQGG